MKYYLYKDDNAWRWGIITKDYFGFTSDIKHRTLLTLSKSRAYKLSVSEHSTWRLTKIKSNV